MPRRRNRKTNRRHVDERRLSIRAIRRSTPDARRLSRAFIGLALARTELEAEAQDDTRSATDKGAGRAGQHDR